jgi:hypothetical protein
MLLVWSRTAVRPELWEVGMPIALGGMACLAVGFMIHFDLLRQEHLATQALARKNRRIHEGESVLRRNSSTRKRRSRTHNA